MVRKKLMQLGLVLLTGIMGVGTASASTGGSGSGSFLDSIVQKLIQFAGEVLPPEVLRELLPVIQPILELLG